MAVGLAGYSSKFLDKSGFATAYGVSRQTVDTYVAALESLYLFDQVPPWTPGDYDRAIRSPKWFATDTGTMAALLDWHRDGIVEDSDRLGKLAETFVYNALAATPVRNRSRSARAAAPSPSRAFSGRERAEKNESPAGDPAGLRVVGCGVGPD